MQVLRNFRYRGVIRLPVRKIARPPELPRSIKTTRAREPWLTPWNMVVEETTTWPHADENRTAHVSALHDPISTGGLGLDGAVMEN